MKILNLLLISLSFQIISAQKKETITIPKHVVYNYCNPKIIEKAKKLIEENINNKDKFELTNNSLIIGPMLWQRFKDNEKINKIEKGNVEFHVDNLVLNGKMSQDINDSKIIWNEFRNEITSDYVIRKLNEQELTYYWSVISFDIEEPLFIVETNKHKYILNLTPKDLKLFWIDEVPNQNEKVIYKDGQEIKKLDKGNKETALESLEFLNTDAELKANTSIEDISFILDKTKKIFEDLFKNQVKSGKIMLFFELKKDKNNISFAIKDDIDLEVMKEFEKRILELKLPNSKKDPIKFNILFKVNSFNETN